MASMNPFDNINERLQHIEEKLQLLVNKPNPEPQSEEKYLTIQQVSELLSVSRVTLWNWEKAGILKSFRIGNLKRYRQSEINDLGRVKS